MPLIVCPVAVVGKVYELIAAPGTPWATHSAATRVPLAPLRAVERTSHGSPIEPGGVPITSWVPDAGVNNSPILGARTARW